jgi:hypothetical protein
MLYLFFTIVFIAELVVLEKIVSLILKLKGNVHEMNCKIVDFKPKMKDYIKNFRSVVGVIFGKLDCFVTFVAQRRTDCSKRIKKGLLMTVLGFILRIPTKQVLTIVDILMMVRKVWKRA